MDVDGVLFGLRVASGALLVVLLLALLVVLWREYRVTARHSAVPARSLGQLVDLTPIDDAMYAETGGVYPLQPVTSLGRAPTNSIVIDEQTVSSEHAVISLKRGQWWLEDRQSRNGTRLNGDPIDAPTIITDGDVIGVGTRAFRLALG